MSDYEQEQKLEIPAKYLAAVSRFKWAMGAGILFLGAIAVAVSMLLPATYRSEGIVLVETQQISDELVRSTVTSVAAERIQIIRQRVMTRERLLELMDKYPQLHDWLGGELVSQRVAKFRENVAVDLISSNSRSRTAATIAFKISFDGPEPAMTQAVANDLVTMFLDENVRARTERASETTGFLKSEADKMRKRLAETETAIAVFKNDNADTLPEHLDLYLSMLERARGEATDIRRQIEVQTNQISLYEGEIAASRPDASQSPELVRLEAEYARLTSLYLPSHPDVRSIQQQIDTAKSIRKTSTQDQASRVFESKIEAARKQRVLLRNELVESEADIARLEAQIVKIPQVEQGLIALNRDYEAVQSQYEQLVGSTMQAQMAESLEQGRKAERFSLLEAPVVPDQPHSPDRKMILGGGLAASAGLPLALVLAFGFF
ncbi:MAG: GumC family protein, partial [Litorivicinus sp.]